MKPRSRDDGGRVVVFVVVLGAAIAACFGLVLDGGRMLIDKTRASTLAHEASRAGARELDEAAVTEQGQVQLDASAARERARQHLRAAGATGTARVQGSTVTVVAEVPYSTTILPLGEGIARARAEADMIRR
ncbi:pilus assembly protein TadG-related protein [Streptomonospora salina]|uniref:F0F1-type ATP synthase epsilon subunit n=1 Tax=Streptomonospora salina TaxID=104205 RepID=A0A841E3L6_9ACTN|nr:pilus assembly protein TadG-related protein [Streptomonospora salina]MBB5998437.1 F0F1-type ATP synthase epsilon subunit [Streptomonospora salina]